MSQTDSQRIDKTIEWERAEARPSGKVSDSPCYRPIVAYYFQSAREKAGSSSRVRRHDEAEVFGASDGPKKMRQNNYGATVHFPQRRPGALI
jgi:hypothetical protein